MSAKHLSSALAACALAGGLFLPVMARADCTNCATNPVGGDVVHTWTSTATCTGANACTFTPPAGVNSVQYLVIGGGGGGGAWRGGGGGAGGFLSSGAFAVTPLTVYNVTVGAGGAGAPGGTTAQGGSDGLNSAFGVISATGGGGGGLGTNSGNAGGAGGSGGGAGGAAPAGSLAPGNGTGGQGNNGGDSFDNNAAAPRSGGGGGGAGAVGQAAGNAQGGNGGAGSSDSITGASVTYAGGGGGASNGGGAGTGGSGGGGNGITNGDGQDGTDGLGGGGGGAGGGFQAANAGGDGGDGVVIVRYTPVAFTCPGGTQIASGIEGDYYGNMTLTDPPTGTRLDGPIDFDWGAGTPGVTGIGADNFSVRWDGAVRVTATGNYQFQTVSDDGVRLYVNGALIIDNWTDHGPTTDTSGVVALTADQLYSLTLEFYENGGGAVIRLRMGPAGGPYTAIPAGPAPPSLGQGLYYCEPAGATAGITVTLNEAAIEINAGSISFTDAYLGPPELTATATITGSATISTDVGAPGTGAMLVDIVGAGDSGSFSAGGSQIERWDRTDTTATGAMSTRSPAGNGVMDQDFGSTPNRMAHIVASLLSATGGSIAFDTVASADDANVATLNWNHVLGTTELTTTKIVVGVEMEDEDCAIEATSVTFGNLQLTRAAEAEIDTGACQRVELWWGDLTPIYVSSAANATLGGVGMDQDEAIEYTAITNTGTLVLDDGTPIFTNDANLDGFGVLASGNFAISTVDNETLSSGGAVTDGNVVEITPAGVFVQTLFAETSFVDNTGEDIDALYIRDNGNIIMSTLAAAQFDPGAGGLAMDDDDLVEWNPNTGTATLFFNMGSVAGGGANVDGVFLLNDDPNLILFSLTANTTLGGTNYLDGDVILYNRNNGVFSRYFAESNYTGDEETNAFSLPQPVVSGPAIAQFDISFATTGSTCLSSEIVITAEDISGNTLTNYGGTVDLSTSTGNGEWSMLDEGGGASSDPAQGTLTPGANDSGAATYTFVPGDSGTIALFLANQHAETLTITVFDSTAGVSSVSGLSIAFSDNVFVITPNTCTGATCPGTGSNEVVAGRDHGFHIAMYRRDNSLVPPTCGVATNYTGSKNLKAWIVRDGSDPAGTLPTLAEQIAALGDGAAPGADNLVLDFTATPGEADFTLQTADVGKYLVNVRDDSGTFAAGDIDGGSATLTVRPFGLGFTSLTGLIPNPGAATPAGGLFATAGSDFSGTVGGYRWSGADDVGNDGVPDTNADVTNNGLTVRYAWATTVTAAPNTPTVGQGGVLGTFNNGAIAQGSFSGGSATVANFQYVEVGSIILQASATGYLGSGGVDISGSSGIVGRFAADHFDFVVDTAPQLGAACTAFTYIDQGFDFSNTPQITARALAANSGTVLQNYHNFSGAGGDNWWLLDLGAGIAQVYGDPAAPAGVTFVDAAGYSPTGGSGINGQVQFTLDGPFTYDDRSAAPYGPVDAFDAQVALDFTVTDTDGATGTYSVDPITFASPEQRWGRMIIGTAAGSELLPLAVPMRTEYFDGGAFIASADDACTSVAAAELVLTSEVEGPITGDTVQIRPGATSTATIANAPFVQGQAGLSFSSPGEGMTGYADITLDLGASGEDWLRFDRDGDGVPDNDPSGRAAFGIFGGNDRLIYTREPWN